MTAGIRTTEDGPLITGSPEETLARLQAILQSLRREAEAEAFFNATEALAVSDGRGSFREVPRAE